MVLLDAMLHDLRYGIRQLARHPRTTVLTVLALALGIGVNTAVFTIYKSIVSQQLDATNPGRMANLALSRKSGAIEYSFSYPDYEAYRDSLHSFSGLIAYRPARVTLATAGGIISQQTTATTAVLGGLTLVGSGISNAEFASISVVSENYFSVLGVGAIQGRTFESISIPELSATPSVLISENYWQRRFAGDPTIVGQTVRLNDVEVTIIGITPHNFVGTGTGAPAFWVPVTLEPMLHDNDQWLHDRETQRYRLFGRLARGVNIAEAQAEMSPVANHIRTLHNPRSESAESAAARVWPGSPFPIPLKQAPGLTVVISLLLTATGMVLAVACANVSSLQLARIRSRQNELRTRMSLGADRLRVIRQLLTESALLGFIAGALALFSSWALLKVSITFIADALPVEFVTIVFEVSPDPGIFAFVSGISFVAGILSGLPPAMESSGRALSDGMNGGTSSVRGRRLQDILVAVQVALSLFLMIFGSMAIRSARNSISMDTGYESKHVLALNVRFPENSRYSGDHKLALVRELRSRLDNLPSVAITTSAQAPGDGIFRTLAAKAGENTASAPNASFLYYAYVQANYFDTLGIPVILGRSFQGREGQPEYSVILSESAAKQLWPGTNPLGRSIRLGPIDEKSHFPNEMLASGPAYQVIGVARDVRGADFDANDSKRVYLPMSANRIPNYPILIRTRSKPEQMMAEIDTAVSSTDPNMVTSGSTLENMLYRSALFVGSTVVAALAWGIGLLGLCLALMGIYGTITHLVVLRTKEVGIRMAIGAQNRDVLRLILGDSARPLITGLIGGMLLAIVASYLARGLFFGLHAIDGVSVGGVSLLFLVIGLLASYAPARRAVRVDPLVALRQD